VTPETDIALRLCARLNDGARPLTAREYHALKAELVGGILALSSHLPDESTVDHGRLTDLLSRDVSAHAERWTDTGIWVLSPSDVAYPEALRSLGLTAPPLLFGAGSAGGFSCWSWSVAVVGSRHANDDQLETARRIGVACALTGCSTVSGGARGIDAVAMNGALSEGGNVVAVLSHGLRAAARRHRAWLETGKLLLLSPYLPEAGFSAGNAMGRNRFIHGLADASVVAAVEAGRGGTWHGAVEALTDGQTVFLTPGSGGEHTGLSEMGALPFSPPEPWEQSLGTWLSAQESLYSHLTSRQLRLLERRASMLHARQASPSDAP
jgi:predicted Rossmann fold nucleotide-binding protein DprA/Smf involved in DNA uptake